VTGRIGFPQSRDANAREGGRLVQYLGPLVGPEGVPQALQHLDAVDASRPAVLRHAPVDFGGYAGLCEVAVVSARN